MEAARVSGDLIDARWRTVFISSELARLNGVEPSEVGRFYGESMIVRHLDHPMIWGTDEKTALEWWRQIVPIMRHYLDPGDPDFEAIFSHNAEPGGPRRSRSTSRRAPGTRGSPSRPSTRSRRRCSATSASSSSASTTTRVSSSASCGSSARRCPRACSTRLGRGDQRLFERMDRVSEPRPPRDGDPLRGPRGLRRAVAASVDPRLLRSRQRSHRPDRLERDRARRDRRQARRRRGLGAVPRRRLRRL